VRLFSLLKIAFNKAILSSENTMHISWKPIYVSFIRCKYAYNEWKTHKHKGWNKTYILYDRRFVSTFDALDFVYVKYGYRYGMF